jgi:hypothetical protein
MELKVIKGNQFVAEFVIAEFVITEFVIIIVSKN